MNLEQLKNVFVKFLVDQELLRRKMVTSRVTNLQKSERVEREKIREETKIRKKQLSDFTWLFTNVLTKLYTQTIPYVPSETNSLNKLNSN